MGEGAGTDDAAGDVGRAAAAASRWRRRYEGSFAHEVASGLSAADFGNKIILFGACVLLSVLPLVIILGAFAGTRVDDDIARHLGLNRAGAVIVEGLFHSAPAAFDFAVIFSLILSIAGTIAVAASVQSIYEGAFELPHHRGLGNVLRCTVWVALIGGLLIVDGYISGPIHHAPAGVVFVGLTDLALMTAFFWWSMWFLLAGRVRWTRLGPAALITALCWIGLGVVAALYFSSTLVSDSHLYGTIGVVFTLVTWFIAVGAVFSIGATVGAVIDRRRAAGRHRAAEHGRGSGDHLTS
jgi:membrane protein